MKVKIFCGTASEVENQINSWEDYKIIHNVQLHTTNDLTTIAVWYKESEAETTHLCSCCGCSDIVECGEDGMVGYPVE